MDNERPRRWDTKFLDLPGAQANQGNQEAMGLQVVLGDLPNPSAVQRGRHFLPRPAPTLKSLSRAAMPSVFNDARLHLSDFLSYSDAFSIKEDSSRLFRGPIGSPCNVLFSPFGSSSVKFVSEQDDFATASGHEIILGTGQTGSTLVGLDGQFALLLVQHISRTCFFRVYDLVTDDLKAIGAPPLASSSSSTEAVDIRIGFLVHQASYIIVCLCLLKKTSHAYLYDSTRSANGWVNVQFAIPRHLTDYVATRYLFELLWLNLDRESGQINVMVFDTFTELFTLVEVQDAEVTQCKTASILSVKQNKPGSTTIDLWLCMLMNDSVLRFYAYEEQDDGSYLFVPRFNLQGPNPSPEGVLFSIGGGVLICTNGASVWRVDFPRRTVKRVSVVPQLLGEEAPIYHTFYAGSLEQFFTKLKIRLLQ